MRKLLIVVVLSALAVPGPALAVDRHVSMKSNRLSDYALKALPGDNVVWTNNEIVSTTRHNVTSTLFPSSGDLLKGQSHATTFGGAGSYPYVCTYHRATMSGRVVVADIHLSGPTTILNHGASAQFRGLAAPGSGVTIHSDDGTVVATATAGGDGTFSATVPMARPGSYHAAAGGARTSSVAVKVRPRLALNSRRSGSRWVKIAGGRLNTSSKATFRVARKAMSIRARTTRGVSGYAVTTSRVLAVR